MPPPTRRRRSIRFSGPVLKVKAIQRCPRSAPSLLSTPCRWPTLWPRNEPSHSGQWWHTAPNHQRCTHPRIRRNGTMSTLAIQSTGYQTLTLDQMHESSTNPRRTFEPNKLAELAESLRTHGLIQPITVRPHDEGFEIVAGARRFRAAQIAGLDEVPVRILNLSDEQTVEIQIIENSQRIDVH